ncbi:hypothetical protein [Caballeronia sp. NCTM1]|uniref:hypothetical protein n=1 Tax=Caballeronia sp. NCTM1 TaxID=2921753 RepID=UPI0020298160|nr:hypothetical protein [Caballeronia sp. NCTM1]
MFVGVYLGNDRILTVLAGRDDTSALGRVVTTRRGQREAPANGANAIEHTAANQCEQQIQLVRVHAEPVGKSHRDRIVTQRVTHARRAPDLLNPAIFCRLTPFGLIGFGRKRVKFGGQQVAAHTQDRAIPRATTAVEGGK